MSTKICYCINPHCSQSDHPANPQSNFCNSCGSSLLINGKYRVKALLSDLTGFGLIYEAIEGYQSKILKVLKPEHNQNQKAIDLFKQEYQVLLNLTNQGITSIPQVNLDDYFAYTTNNGLTLHCFVMEKVEGIDLLQWLKNNGQLTQKQGIKWLREITQILAKVHEQNYFHRDIKPPNIMQRNKGELVLIDFGTAREETQTYYQKIQGQGVTGIISQGYTPSEQQYGQAVIQSDFFALGRTFVHLLTGKSPLELYDPINDQFPWRSHTENINPLFLDFIDYLMAKLPKDRPTNTNLILQQLEQIETQLNHPLYQPTISINQNPTQATIPLNYKEIPESNTNPDQPQKSALNKVLLALGGVLLVALGIGSFRFFPFSQTVETADNNNKNSEVKNSENSANNSPEETTNNQENNINNNPDHTPIQKIPLGETSSTNTEEIKSSPVTATETKAPEEIEKTPIETTENKQTEETQKPSSQTPPENSVNSYYQAINNGNYPIAWAKLPISLKNNRRVHPLGYNSFQNWFSQIQPITITNIRTLENQNGQAKVNVSYQYILNQQTINESLTYSLIWNEQSQDWDFQSIESSR